MKSQATICVKNSSVAYNFNSYAQTTFKEFMLAKLLRRSKVPKKSKLVALDSVSLEIRRGESVAFIGHNGSGKSTLLKVIAGIIEPHEGTVQVMGRIAPMIELGAGFDPELSGHENISLSCLLMGLTHLEIESARSSIVRFAELEEFIDLPIKHYSSGMQARLGFACATAVNPDVLLVDEVLSVGDANFARKCLERVAELKRKGTTVVLVSHDDGTVRNFCDRAVVLRKGRVVFQGSVNDALKVHHSNLDEIYLDRLETESRQETNFENKTKLLNEKLPPSARVLISVVQNQAVCNSVRVNEPFEIKLELCMQRVHNLLGQVNVGFGINSIDGRRITGWNLAQAGVPRIQPQAFIDSKMVHVSFVFDAGLPALAHGFYELVCGVVDNGDARALCETEPKSMQFCQAASEDNLYNDLIHLSPALVAANV